MPLGAGKKGAPEWAEFSMVEGTSKATCKHCNCEISSKIERLRTHLQKCTKREGSSGSMTAASADTEPRDTPCKRKQQGSLKDFVVQTTAKQKEELDISIARFFYANNTSFNVASSKEYQKMIEMLRPGYVGPNRMKLSGPLLDQVATEVDDELIKFVSEGSITLLMDGWSNTNNDPIMAVSMHTGKTSYLLNAIDCEANKKTADFCVQVAKEAIDLCKEKFEKEVFAICTDNKNKMNKMRETLEKDDPHLITYGCSAHYANLLENVVTPAALIKHIVEVHKYFRNHHPHGWLKERNGRMPQIPNITRWNSQNDCVATFIENHPKYMEIVAEHHDEIPGNINKLLDNAGVYREAIRLQKQLSEVSRLLNLMQADDTYIADAVELWYELFANAELEPYKHSIEKRMKDALKPIHFLTNILHPTYKGQKISIENEDAVDEWLTKTHPDWLPLVMAFKIKDKELYPPSMFSEGVIKQFTARKWWILMENRTSKKGNLPGAFYAFVANLHACPASSASLERIFSNYGFVWSTLRNRLGHNKAEKLVKIYKALNDNTDCD